MVEHQKKSIPLHENPSWMTCCNHSALLVLSSAFIQIQRDMVAVVRALCFPKPVDNKKTFLWAICSWKTGAPKNNYSRKVMTARAVLGQPAVENAVSQKDIFSEEYSSKERAAGRDREEI